jgi:hypothetical protein
MEFLTVKDRARNLARRNVRADLFCRTNRRVGGSCRGTVASPKPDFCLELTPDVGQQCFRTKELSIAIIPRKTRRFCAAHVGVVLERLQHYEMLARPRTRHCRNLVEKSPPNLSVVRVRADPMTFPERRGSGSGVSFTSLSDYKAKPRVLGRGVSHAASCGGSVCK